MARETSFVFVYGTLRKGGRNDHYLEDAELISNRCRTIGKLYDSGVGYPALIPSGEEWVWGEVYAVSLAQLQQLNVLEGYYGAGSNNEYERVIQDIYCDQSLEHMLEAYVYVFEPDQVQGFAYIPSGDWISYIQKRD